MVLRKVFSILAVFIVVAVIFQRTISAIWFFCGTDISAVENEIMVKF